MADAAHIDELRRRVERDPASIAFAHLAEEYRRIGRFDDAVRVSSVGLAVHPAYLSARVTRGRALIGLQRYDEAESDLAFVIHAAPDNLSASRALAELRQRRGTSPGPSDANLPSPDSRILGELESWLSAIRNDRERRTRGQLS